eukprot:CAMPEP_0168339874 /NCGR_PEP_ID=MMETSP0213-20121227/13727_1 /TAXON_ID=151035 /ORGANISM="Euplotes harpa, Strain FSP1.4" /LENGTH=160 /DNA_ID=CAMNT_0008346001 /DNA_START=129 /DNA_END=611 /DNA_ORIENTATION=+
MTEPNPELSKSIEDIVNKRMEEVLSDFKQQQQKEMTEFLQQHAAQVEELELTISEMSQNLIELNLQKQTHCQKLCEVIAKQKDKYQALKNELKYLSKKMKISGESFSTLNRNFEDSQEENKRLAEIIVQLKAEIADLSQKNKSLNKKLFKLQSRQKSGSL